MKLLNRNTSSKEIKVQAGTNIMTLNATTSLFARMLVVARSSRDDINSKHVIGTHEFGALMQADRTLHPINYKSSVIHLLYNLVTD